mgnify:CR=1 FL=1
MAEAVVTLKKGEGRSLKAGGLWIYDNEIDTIMGTFTNGDIVLVHDFDGYIMGRGYINQNSKIRIRMLTRDASQEIDDAFLEMRVRNAWAYRKRTVDTSACRVIFGEADFLPGLVIDKFSDVLVVESLALGIDKMKLQIVDILKKVLLEDGIKIRGVYERSDAKERLKEGMDRKKGFIGDEFDTDVEIVENGVRYIVDVKDGQKTGFFLDQKYNRRAVARIAAGHTVLDCFTHTGSFALNAAKGGAARVTAADISAEAIAMAQRNAQRNNLTNMDFLCEDTFELLPRLEKEGHPYDFIILDPPAFTKARRTVENAMRGYKEINYRAMKLLPRGGYLATASCSHFATEELFIKMLHAAAKDAHRQLRQIEVRQQAPDHPILWGVPETNYLKFFLFQVI